MCGIAGWIGASQDVTPLRVALLCQSLLQHLEERGRDGTGYVLSNGERHLMVKKAVRPAIFIAEGYTERMFMNRRLAPYNYVLLHARQASDRTTVGVDRNCHPFAVKSGNNRYSYGIHNGNAMNAKKLAADYGVRHCTVDSETMFQSIAARQRAGVSTPEAIIEVVQHLDTWSDYACAYLTPAVTDGRRSDLYLWRNDHRPLYFLDARKIGMGRFFCSTKEIFQTAWASLRGYLGRSNGISCSEAKPHTLYKATPDGALDVVTTWECPAKYYPADEPLLWSDRASHVGGVDHLRRQLIFS